MYTQAFLPSTLIALSFLAASSVNAQIAMNVSTQPSSGVAGVTNANAIGSGFPIDHGDIDPANVTLTLSSSCGGAAIATAKALSVTVVTGTQRRVNFAVPGSLVAGNYFVTLAGTTSDGSIFSSNQNSCSEISITHASVAHSSCVASGTLSVNAPPAGGTVTAYAANGYWDCASEGCKGIRAVPIEGDGNSTLISTPNVVNSCATNSLTSKTVCTSNGRDVYLISGTTLNTTLQSGSSSSSTRPVGTNNLGVVVDPVNNRAFLSMSLDLNVAGFNTGFQILDLTTNTFGNVIPAKNKISDEIVVDPDRSYVLSPNDAGNYDIFPIRSDGSATEFANQLPGPRDWESAAEDCSTGIALASTEGTNGDVYIGDLLQAKFDSDKRTWTAPGQIVHLNQGNEQSDMTGIAIAPGSNHLGILTTEGANGGPFIAIQLPSTSGAGMPNLVDYVRGDIRGFMGTLDPHAVTAYVSPNDGKAYGIIASNAPPTDLARIDLACVLAQPRDSSNHVLAAYPSSCIKIFSTGNAPPSPPTFTTPTPHTTATTGLLYQDKIYANASNPFGLTYSLSAAPTGMSIDSANGSLQWIPTTSQVGVQTFTAVVKDVFGLTAEKTFSITVSSGQNIPPVITSSPSTRSVVGTLYTYQVQATDRNPTSLRYSLLAAPVGMTIDAVSGLLQWTPDRGLANQTAHVTVQVSDSFFLYASQTFTIALIPAQNHPPVITSLPVTTASIGQLYSYQVRASDPDNDPLAFSFVSAPVGMTINPVTGLIQWTPGNSDLGDLNVTVRTQDPGALVATQTFHLQIQRAYPVPTIEITSPTVGAILNKPVDIVANIIDNSSFGPAITWTVDLLRGDNRTRRIASGSGPVSGSTIAHIDPTLLRDDAYSVVITVSKGGEEDSKSFDYSILTGSLKLGNFTTSFTDISIPVAGIPMVITRTYDSLDVSTQEFGNGWRLSLPGQVVDSARETPLEAFTQKTRVYVTRPDGKREGFTFSPTPPQPFLPFWRPKFQPDPGVTDTLAAYDADLTETTIGFFDPLTGPYNPSTYTLTTKLGLEYTINEVEGLQQIKDRNGNTLTITVDGIQSSSGLSLPFEHDSEGRITRITEPGGGSVRYVYDGSGNLTSSFDQMGNETKYSYEDPNFTHYLTKVQDPLGRPVTRMAYDSQGRIVAQCDASGDVTTLHGCILYNTDPILQSQTVVNGRGFKTQFLMDDRGNVLSEMRFTDEVNHLDTVHTYDENNNLISTVDASGNMFSATYDQKGNQTSASDSAGHKVTISYNTCNQAGSYTDENGNTTTFLYDATCNLRFIRSPSGAQTEIRYNNNGAPTDLFDPLRSHWGWQYDSIGHLSSLTDPSGATVQYGVSPAGELLWRVDRMQRRVEFSYNSAHYPVAEKWLGSQNLQRNFSYNGANQLTSISQPNGLTVDYDGSGRISNVTTLDNPTIGTFSLSYKYDEDGNVSKIEDSFGSTIQYIYDALDRPASIIQAGEATEPKMVKFQYDASDLVREITRYSGVNTEVPVEKTEIEYDCGGCGQRIESISEVDASTGNSIRQSLIQRDNKGNVTEVQDDTGRHQYKYDSDDQLKSVTHDGASGLAPEQYTYDLAGNRTASQISDVYTYSYQFGNGGNRLMSDSKFQYAYDAEGNLRVQTDVRAQSRTEYAYDFRNRLINITQFDSSSSSPIGLFSLQYDALSRLSSASDGVSDHRWLYDGFNPIIASLGSSQQRRLYGRAIDSFYAQDRGQGILWALKDQVGTVRMLFDGESNPAANKYSFDSFGAPISTEQFVPTFSSREFVMPDLIYFRARFYQPSTGRFTQEDPRKPFGYQYGWNNPLIFSDPTGDQAYSEYKNTNDKVAEGELPCEYHHIFPKYAAGQDIKQFWYVTRRWHKAFHIWLSSALPYKLGSVPLDELGDILSWMYENFDDIEFCPGSEPWKVFLKNR